LRSSPALIVVALTGEVDLANVATLEQALAKAVLGSVPEIVVDLGNLSFMDAAGIGALVMGAVRLAQAGRKLRLVNVSPFYERVLNFLQLDWLLTGELPRLRGLTPMKPLTPEKQHK
jgi:anti-anti-sigma factor